MNDEQELDLNKISEGENITLNGAGVQLTDEKKEEEADEEIVELGTIPNIETDPDLKKVGLTFNETSEERDLNLLKEKMEKKNEESSSVPLNSLLKNEPKNAPVSESKPEPLPESKTTDILPKATPAKVEETPADTSDLEKEFNQTINSAPEKTQLSLNEKVSGLTSMLSKVKEKLGLKKTEVKKELEDLKKVKNDIAKDIENIKELEESEQKIEAELKKVEGITNEIEDIEKEVEEELKS